MLISPQVFEKTLRENGVLGSSWNFFKEQMELGVKVVPFQRDESRYLPGTDGYDHRNWFGLTREGKVVAYPGSDWDRNPSNQL